MPAEVLSAARGVLVIAAIACLWRALLTLRRTSRFDGRSSGSRLRWRMVAWLVDRAGQAAARSPLLRRRGNDPTVRAALSLSPGASVCRLIGGGQRSFDDPGARAAGARALSVGVGTGQALAILLVLGASGLPVALAVAGAAVAVPDALLAAVARSGRRRLLVALPPALDLLALCIDAGASLERALAVAAGRSPDPAGAVLARAVARVSMGVPIAAALRREAEACRSAALTTVAGTVERGRAIGTPLAPPLRALAQTLRAEARTAMIERAGRVGPMASLLTATVIAPSCVMALLTLVVGGTLAQSSLA